MKIKTDFVTNSSSTCFVVMMKDNMTLPQFLRLVGISNDSMFVDVFSNLFQCFKRDLISIDAWMRKYSCQTLEDFVKRSYMSPGTLDRIKKAQERAGEDERQRQLQRRRRHKTLHLPEIQELLQLM